MANWQTILKVSTSHWFVSVVDIKTIAIAVGVTVAVLLIIGVIVVVLLLLHKKRFDCFLYTTSNVFTVSYDREQLHLNDQNGVFT